MGKKLIYDKDLNSTWPGLNGHFSLSHSSQTMACLELVYLTYPVDVVKSILLYPQPRSERTYPGNLFL